MIARARPRPRSRATSASRDGMVASAGLAEARPPVGVGRSPNVVGSLLVIQNIPERSFIVALAIASGMTLGVYRNPPHEPIQRVARPRHRTWDRGPISHFRTVTHVERCL